MTSAWHQPGPAALFLVTSSSLESSTRAILVSLYSSERRKGVIPTLRQAAESHSVIHRKEEIRRNQ